MSTRVRQAFQGAAGAAGAGGGLNVEEVFSTYLYTGNGTSQTITNGIDLSGEGGLVWTKFRTNTVDHILFDTERGALQKISSNTTAASANDNNTLTSFNSDGFSLGNRSLVNQSGQDFASWTFRKAPKFFDVVTYTGNSTSGRTVTHGLGSTPGVIIVRRTDSTGGWVVYHRSLGATKALYLQSTNAESTSSTNWNDTEPTSTNFTLGNSSNVNASGASYVAYLFAHNDGDGDFGPTGDQDIIKCGSFTHSSSTGNDIDLGFEPQWLLYKASDGTTGWYLWDTMRGWGVTEQSQLRADTSSAESTGSNTAAGWPQITSTGFRLGTNSYAGSNKTFIYMAIRRGPMAVPESATDVFAIDTYGGTSPTPPSWNSGFPVDFAFYRNKDTDQDFYSYSRLIQGKGLWLRTPAEFTDSSAKFDFMDGYYSGGGSNSSLYSWMWRRAPNYFDVVAYTGNATAGRTVSHNLGVAPEMMWVKRRDGTSSWYVYYKHDATTYRKMYLDQTSSYSNLGSGDFNSTLPTDSVITLGSTVVNRSGYDYIAYLFASLDGVSKVGSYTGTGAAGNQIDCGFSNGARFVLIKGTDTTYAWVVLDTERGLVSGNDKALFLNSSTSEITFDYADPYSAGFELSSSNIAVNGNGYNYIFYAIA